MQKCCPRKQFRKGGNAFVTQEKIRQKKLERGKRKRKQKAAKQRSLKRSTGKSIAYDIALTINHFFPHLYEHIREIEDFRKRSDYELVEIIMAVIAMFIFKEGSRNAFNNDRKEDRFRRNYQSIFKVRLPHPDTADHVMRNIPEKCFEKLKTDLIKNLIGKKVFHKFRIFGKYYNVVIDGTRVMNVPEGHCKHCLHTTSKNGKVTCFHNVSEGRLVGSNGFSVSLITEWIENPEGDFQKQDCELKAFVRLAKKLKEAFPGLPVCINADGLYPNKTFSDICRDNRWNFIVTFRDGNLPTVWSEVFALEALCPENRREVITYKSTGKIIHTYRRINNIDYEGHLLNWFECREQVGDQTSRFVYITDFQTDYDCVTEMTSSGRMRWKIENEGFNILKNHGYGLSHKYSRNSLQASKNYYQFMQIGHLINRLCELSSFFNRYPVAKTTLRHLWKQLLSFMSHGRVGVKEIANFLSIPRQFRYG